MTVSSLSSLYSTAQVEGFRSASTRRTQASGLPQDPPPQVSKLADYMRQLEELQSSDPEQFKEITAEIAERLQTAADEASENGGTEQASALSDLAEKFQTASEDGTMPDLRPPERREPADSLRSLLGQQAGSDPMGTLTTILESVFSRQ